MPKRRFTPHLLTTSALTLLLGQPLPASAQAPNSSADAVTNNTPTTTIQMQIPPGEAIRIKTTPEGNVIIDTVTEQPADTNYRKDWYVSNFSSLLQSAFPIKPENFSQRPLLGVIDIADNQTNYNKAIKINDEKLSATSGLLLKRLEVLSTRVTNKLSYEEQQYFLSFPRATLLSRYAPTFFSTQNLLVLRAKEDDRYAGYLVDLSTLNVRVLSASTSNDAVQAHTELVQLAWDLCVNPPTTSELLRNVPPPRHKPLREEMAPPVGADAPPPAADANVNAFPPADSASDAVTADTAAEPAAHAYAAPTAPADAATEPAPADAEPTMTMPDFSKVITLERRTMRASRGDVPNHNAAEASDAANVSDTEEQSDGEMTLPDFSKTWRTRQHPDGSAFARGEQNMPLASRHVYDPCFDEVYLRLLEANGLDRDECPAYLIAYNDICAFPYYSDGPLYVTTGLYRHLSNSGELAAALARELAQVLLGYVDDERTEHFEYPDRPWMLSKQTLDLLEEVKAWRNAASMAEAIALSRGLYRPYWYIPSYMTPYYENPADYAYFALLNEQMTKVDRLAATMCYVAGFDPESYASYMDKITSLSAKCEYPNGDLNLWLPAVKVDKPHADDIVAVAEKLSDFNKHVLELQRRDPALAQALRAHTAIYLKDPEKVTRYMQDYRKILPLE